MFSKVLVANRGEIAVRVLQTLRAMGVATVAVYAEPDANAPHVVLADEAHGLGGASAEETYLDRRKLIELAGKCGAEAVHPGYGFLAENPAFSRECAEAGLVFIGPSPETMELLGDKIRSKETAVQAGVPVVPSSPMWVPGDSQPDAMLSKIGLPLLVKAAAGGGGRGMRIVEQSQELEQALESASREAASSFGDGSVFLEKYIPAARHVEFQVLADSAGNTIHLLERECSVQRRYQKVIEEAPSPALNDELRHAMATSAVTMAKSAGYSNAGTVEFLVDARTGDYYFLEMNARIQVEHPVTEEILKLDMVEWQTRIAAGELITLSQDEIRPSGHALECRIYAEDPYSNFAPAVGRLQAWRPPSGIGIRLDSGVAEGLEITSHYDSMLAKLVAWGPDRQVTIQRMLRALESFPVIGVTTNIPFLIRSVAHSAFRSGEYDTGFIAKYPELTAAPESGDLSAAAAEVAGRLWQSDRSNIGGQATAALQDRQGPWDRLTKTTFP